MLPRWFPNIKDPADGNFIEKHIEGISEKTKTCVLYVKGLKGDFPKEIQVQKKKGCTVYIHYHSVNKGPFQFILNPVRYFLKQIDAYRIIKKEHGLPIICHVHVMARSSLLANYLKLFYGIDFLISEHWSGYYPESGKLNGWKNKIYRLLYRKATKVSAVSDSLAKAIENRHLTQNISIIPNIVDDVFLKENINIAPTPKKQLIHVSNLKNDVKQTDRILKCLNEVAKRNSDFTLVIAGDGPDRMALQELAGRLENLRGKVNFTGDVSQDKLARLYSESLACVLFSKFETQSVVLLESMAIGVPVIAPRVGGIPEHCEGRGILFERDSEAGFIEAIDCALEGRMNFNGSELRSYARANFTKSVVSDKFMDLYKQLKPEMNVQ